ncbi:ATP-grasp domain-containing protein [Patescibacteria group bacterium]|nr:ATP-grasp domain-containing protein [Patescibacteria group bacterium]
MSVVILVYVGTHEDDDDTMECAKGIEKALRKTGHAVRKVRVTKKNWKKAVRTPGDVVFNLVEDETWELYVKVGQKLETLGRAQVGHDMKCFLYATKKAWIKRRMKKLGISTPPFRIFNRRSDVSHVRGLDYPVIVKPSHQHAGIGISQDSVVIDKGELEDQVRDVFAGYPGEVIAEEYIEGREIHVTLIGNGRTISAFPYCEISFGGDFENNWAVYTYEAKWDKHSWEYWDARVHAPVRLSPKLHRMIERESIKAYKAFGCRDIARMDVRVDLKDRPYIVDVNMNPSLNFYDGQDATLASVYALGWTYEEFIETVVATTYQRVYGSLPSPKDISPPEV